MALTLDKANQPPKRRTRVSRVVTPDMGPAPKRDSIRPWSGQSLRSKAGSETQSTDSYLNEEWLNLHEAPLFWVDLARDPGFARVQELMLRLEDSCARIQRLKNRVLGETFKLLRHLTQPRKPAL